MTECDVTECDVTECDPAKAGSAAWLITSTDTNRPLEKLTSHTETTSVTGVAASGSGPAQRQATALPEPAR